MVVEASLGAALRVAARPHARVHGVDGRFARASGERMAGEQFPQSLGVDPSSVQCGVKAPPTAAVRRLEAQMGRRRDALAGGEDGVADLEERVGAAVEATVERVAEGAQSAESCRFHSGAFCSPRSSAATPAARPDPRS
jgi:hypothetical protein